MPMHRKNFAGLAWLIDVAGAALFALGLAAAIGALARGDALPTWTLAALLASAVVRSLAVSSAQAWAIAAAQAKVATLRSSLVPRLLGQTGGRAPSIGQAAVLAIDHTLALESYEARFVPARFAAVAAPLAVATIIAFASLVAAGILLFTLIPFAIGMALAGSMAQRASERQLEALGRLSGLFVDRVRALPIIRHFGAEERIARHVRLATDEVAERTVAVLRAAFLSSAVLEFFSALTVALVAVYCGFSLLGLLPFPAPETLSLTEAFFALAMAPEFYLPMRRLAAAYHEKQLGEAAQAGLDALGDPPTPPAAAPFRGIEAEALEIAWPGRQIGPVSLAIGPTGLVALTGPTGSGKTSVLAALAGQIAPTAGRVTPVDPANVAWAGQHPLILPGTLRDNLVLARPEATEAEILEAVTVVGLAPLIAARGLGLPLDHRGSGLSGGERRRLGLARALISDRPLLLCDEPTADLDDASAAQIVALVTELAKTRAIVAATHDGRLVAAGGEVRL